MFVKMKTRFGLVFGQFKSQTSDYASDKIKSTDAPIIDAFDQQSPSNRCDVN